ncbi:succinyl-diaminopimelate desuccinylase [Kiloniella spongiae]|uniref:Succinyl-diaminopimelate desuccinylase n=1 Tax=Kiloniella spongiae TaxID=1489064 RepID=A0A0H2MNW0_9PROT|nr:succinyl-diaminopimelate desuccinylase [Kiloniella spongiae]KLN62412.1 succinyl-diaminopimelate desuccinylase [Kiloniella spongiae]
MTVENPASALEVSQALIRCPSVTPEEGGALDLMESLLKPLGFECHRLPFSCEETYGVDNLYARLGTNGPVFGYGGHTDVVPIGDANAWSVDPFGGTVVDGKLIGRGTVDMKGSIGAYVAALTRFLKSPEGKSLNGSLNLIITGDEEGLGLNGTRKVLDWMTDKGEKMDVCLVGEPTSNTALGDMVKIGRRGSMNFALTVRGIQGHTAYPQLANNPLHPAINMLHNLLQEPLDSGTEHFPPSSLQLTSVDVGNPTTNVIPAEITANFNVRFNDLYTSEQVEAWVRERLHRADFDYDLKIRVSGESFLCPPGPFSDLIGNSILDVTGVKTELGTSGGTSDARFIKDYATVAEFGLLNDTAHKVDEHCTVQELEDLSKIYETMLRGYFNA